VCKECGEHFIPAQLINGKYRRSNPRQVYCSSRCKDSREHRIYMQRHKDKRDKHNQYHKEWYAKNRERQLARAKAKRAEVKAAREALKSIHAEIKMEVESQ